MARHSTPLASFLAKCRASCRISGPSANVKLPDLPYGAVSCRPALLPYQLTLQPADYYASLSVSPEQCRAS